MGDMGYGIGNAWMVVVVWVVHFREFRRGLFWLE